MSRTNRKRIRSLPACLTAWFLVTAPAWAAEIPKWEIPVRTHRLANGLTVVVSEDHSTPTFGISIAYKVGFRLEPKGRTGFAHLFEHMMFQGTPNAPKGTFDRVIEGGGGVNNGSTRYDYTDYIASAPVSALEPILWLESDRMKSLDFSPENLANQKEVVKEEIRQGVTNRPYGAFVWIDIGTLSFDKWENGHDGYGSFVDLDAATVEDVRSFHRTYYAPNNAVLALAGDLNPDEAFALVEKYFGAIPSQPSPPAPDVAEELNSKERTLRQDDQFAQVPGLAVAYKVPDPKGPDFLPLAVLGQLLAGGDASRLYQTLIKGKELVLELDGGLAWPLGDYLKSNGPSLLNFMLLYKPTTDAVTILAEVQKEVERIAQEGVPAEELARTKTKMLADYFDRLEMMIDRADDLAIRQLNTGDATTVNQIPTALAAVTSEDLQRVASRYLTTANRSSIDRQPAQSQPQGGGK